MKSTEWIVAVIIAAAAAVIGIGTLAGCDPKAEFAGGDRKLSTEEVAVLVERENAKAVAEAQAAVKQIEREAAERTRAFQRSLDRLISEQTFAREDLADLYDRDAADLRGRAEAIAAAAQKSVDERLAAQAAHAAEIEKQWSGREFVGSILAPAIDAGASLVPGLGAIITTLGGGAGILGLLGMNREKKRKISASEALRAALAAAAMLPEPMRTAFEAALKTQADAADEAVIAKIKKDDDLHAVPEMRIAA